MALDLTIDEQASVTLVITDQGGNPATVDGVPAWAVQDPAIATVDPALDGMSAVVASIDVVGATLVTVTADADRGEGLREIIGTLQVNVTGGEAVFVELVAGVPEPKP